MPAAPIQWNRERRGRGAIGLAAALALIVFTRAAAPTAPPDFPDSPDSPAPPPPDFPDFPAAPSPPARQLAPKAILRKAIAALTREALKARAAGQLARQTADFAEKFEHDLDGEVVARKLLRPVDRDPFIDAYVRWQLTSFRPALPTLTDRQFDGFLAGLPAFLPNPRADQDTVDHLLAWRQTNPLPAETCGRIHEFLDELASRSRSCTALNRPAALLRDWVEAAAGDADARSLQARLQRCAAMIAGGWDVRELKAQLDDRFAAAAGDANLSADRRQRLIEQAQHLAGQRRLWIASGIVVENSLLVETDETAVYDFDVTRWIKPLLDQPEQP